MYTGDMRIATPFDPSQLKNNIEAAKQNLHLAQREVAAYRRHLEQQHGFPIIVKSSPHLSGSGATTTSVFCQVDEVDHHSVFVETCEPAYQPYVLAQALASIETDCLAHNAGAWRCALTSRAATERILDELYEPLIEATPDPRKRELLRCRADWNIRELSLRVRTMPVHLIVARRLYDRFPSLRPGQFVLMNEAAVLAKDELVDLQSPPQISNALHALNVCWKCCVDDLLQTRHVAFHQGPGRSAGEQLYRMASPHLAASDPDDHLTLAQQFAEVLGFPDLLVWESRPVREFLSKWRVDVN